MSESTLAVTDLYRTCVDEIKNEPPTLIPSGSVTTPRRRIGRGASQNPEARQLSRPHPYGAPGRRLLNRLSGSQSTSIERPRISYLEGSEGVEISGGNFVTADGDYIGEVIYNTGVTINNYSTAAPASTAPHVDETEVATGSNPTPLPIQRSCDVYNRHLACKGRGFPLWIPEPNNNLSMEYRRRGIDIGDVGIITKMGNFDFLFNICLPEDHPINRGGVPAGFSPCKPVRSSDIQRYTEFEAGAFLTSTSVDKSRFEGEYLHGTLIFESSAMEGAILTMPDGAETLDLGNVLHFERYMAKNVASWYRYVLVERGRHVENGEVRLVAGRDNSRTWGMATFEKASTHGDVLQLKFRPMEENILGARRYTWESSGAASARTGPSRTQTEELTADGGADVTNQTLFVRTLNARLKSKSWKKLITAIAQELTQLYQDQESYDNPPESFASSPSSSGGSSTNGADAHPGPSREPMVRYKDLASINSNPPVARIAHPADIINELALQNTLEDSDEIDMIITSDEDWMSVITENDLVLPRGKELLNRIMECRTIQWNKDDGFISFGPDPGPEAVGKLIAPWPWVGIEDWNTPVPSTPPSSGPLSMPSAPRRAQGRNLFDVSDESMERTALDTPPEFENEDPSTSIMDVLVNRATIPTSSTPSTPRRARDRYWYLAPPEAGEMDADDCTDLNQSVQNTENAPDSLLNQLVEASPAESLFPFVTPDDLGTLEFESSFGVIDDKYFNDFPLFPPFGMPPIHPNEALASTPSTSSTLSTPSTVILTPGAGSVIAKSISSGFLEPSKSTAIVTEAPRLLRDLSSSLSKSLDEYTHPTRPDKEEGMADSVHHVDTNTWNWDR